MAHKTLVGGTAYDTKGGKCLVGGTGYGIKKGRTLVGGTGYDISFATELRLGSIPEGELVYLEENGTPVPFYVTQHNYQPSLNGYGRTLLVRKEVYKLGIWGTSAFFSSSDIYACMIGEYAALHTQSAQDAMATTIILQHKNYETLETASYSRKIFILSAYEMGWNLSSSKPIGTAVPIASALRIATMDGAPVSQWLRDLGRNGGGNVLHFYVKDTGECYSGSGSGMTNGNLYGYRPVFTLPASSVFDEETRLFVSSS
jgi:hypothetical protein